MGAVITNHATPLHNHLHFITHMASQIAELQASYEKSVDEKDTLTKNIEQTQSRLKRAAKLTTGLADEQVRWAESVKVSNSH